MLFSVFARLRKIFRVCELLLSCLRVFSHVEDQCITTVLVNVRVLSLRAGNPVPDSWDFQSRLLTSNPVVSIYIDI